MISTRDLIFIRKEQNAYILLAVRSLLRAGIALMPEVGSTTRKRTTRLNIMNTFLLRLLVCLGKDRTLLPLYAVLLEEEEEEEERVRLAIVAPSCAFFFFALQPILLDVETHDLL